MKIAGWEKVKNYKTPEGQNVRSKDIILNKMNWNTVEFVCWRIYYTKLEMGLQVVTDSKSEVYQKSYNGGLRPFLG